jgi:WXG100 family type VII secretion target
MMNKLQVSSQKLDLERRNNLNLAHEVQTVSRALGHEVVSAHWTGNSFEEFRKAWDRYGSLLNGIAEALEVLSSDLAEAAVVYEDTDRNAVK